MGVSRVSEWVGCGWVWEKWVGVGGWGVGRVSGEWVGGVWAE